MPEQITSIHELFNRDPLSQSDKDIDEIINWYRKNRKRYMLGETQAGSAQPKRKLSAKAKELIELKKTTGKVDLSDLL